MFLRLYEYIEERYINLDLVESFEFSEDINNENTCCIVMCSGEKIYVDYEWWKNVVKKHLKGKLL